MLRYAAFAGQFYPGSQKSLVDEVQKYLKTDKKPKQAIGVVSPHAGYIYSGRTAGAVFASVIVPPICIVISPNHTGMGANAAIMNEGTWEIPTGKVPINTDIANLLISKTPALEVDSTAHQMEHSLEVQLPFLLARQPELEIVPICLKHIRFEECESIGKAIASTIEEAGKDILIVASSDMNHYEGEEITRKKDTAAIEKVLGRDPKGLLTTCAKEQITMCGVVPTAVMLIAANELGAKETELVSHTTSGDTSGDYDAVVGYAGMVVR